MIGNERERNRLTNFGALAADAAGATAGILAFLNEGTRCTGGLRENGVDSTSAGGATLAESEELAPESEELEGTTAAVGDTGWPRR